MDAFDRADWKALLNKKDNMYGLNCDYYTKQFNTLDELIDDVMMSGMDPNYEITRDGKGTGEQVIDLIGF